MDAPYLVGGGGASDHAYRASVLTYMRRVLWSAPLRRFSCSPTFADGKRLLDPYRLAVARIDYDAIAHVYDETSWRHRADPLLDQFVQANPNPDRRLRVLDIGCGTGSQLAANFSTHPSLTFLGVDYSIGMLRVARRRALGVRWVRGDGMTLPILDGSFDYVTCQFVHAHILNKKALAREAYRALSPRGQFVQLNIDPWAMTNWLLYRYFPATREHDLEDFIRVEEMVNNLREAGFNDVQIKRDYRDDLVPLAGFLTFVSARHRACQLTAISDSQYRAGLQNLAADVARLGDSHSEKSPLCLVTYYATKTPG